MKWLLDTNIVSEGMRPRPDPGVLKWIDDRPADDLAISIVTLAEIRDGASTLLEGRRRERFEQWIEFGVMRTFENRTLGLTLEILVDWLSLGRRLGARGRPQSSPDLMIAATARAHGLILVSRNLRDFSGTGVTLYDPWTGKTHRMDEL